MKPTDFDNWMIAGEKSTAYRLFCESVYQAAGGCQYNMVAPDQRKALLAALPLTEDMTVLDAGCGTGWMCRWLHEQTGAHMVGMDTASAALEIGGNQAAAKGAENIRFVWGDILSPPFPTATFDAAICIDSLHAQFFKQLELPVKSLAGVIKTAGTMAIFFNALISDDSEKQRLEGDKTHLAEALSTLGLPYEYKDLSESDKGFWLACRAAMQELRELFIADGIEDIYIAGWNEAEQALDDISSERRRRYLYLARIPD